MALDFSGKPSHKEFILMAIRWYVVYQLSYRDIEELLRERGDHVDQATIHRWVLEFDIKGLFDNISHELMMRAVEKHTASPWLILYVRRWLSAKMQMSDGTLIDREKGTPQGGVISPLLANLFLHYAFDKWLQKHYPYLKWCRYADDGVVHCQSEGEAKRMLEILAKRFSECGLELHSEKTNIVYCKDGTRKGRSELIAFDFCGYTFKGRRCLSSRNQEVFTGFNPAVSLQSLKAMGTRLRKLRVKSRTDLSLGEIAIMKNPIIQGWLGYDGRFYRHGMYVMCRLVNKSLIRWAQRKYKSLRKQTRRRASEFMEEISRRSPSLFAHWRAGMVGAFV